MADQFALTKLYDDVLARFTLEGTVVTMAFGWREPAKQLVQGARIVWVPGDYPNGDLGSVAAAKYPGRNPRPLATLMESFYVEIQTVDPTDKEDERKQYTATRALYDAWYRACYLAAHGTFKVVKDNWINARKERRHGSAIRALCTIEAMIPDAALNNANVDEDVSAVVTVQELDVEETNTFPDEGI